MSSLSKEQEIAYLFTLYAVSPTLSTIAVRDPGGYFDPFRDEHYKDPDIIKLYSKEFLDVHEASMRGSIPDLYLKGQGEYFDVLRVNVQAADIGQKTAKQALDDTARDWDRISRRIGRKGPDRAVAVSERSLSASGPLQSRPESFVRYPSS